MSGLQVEELHSRLLRIGYRPADLDVYTTATEAAVREFQASRGLPATGICDGSTWAALVEASYVLGDRLLYLTTPFLRGEDVVELQSRLSSLGFDCGGVDGIFGPRTQSGLRELQRNAGLSEDGVCGRSTIVELHKLGHRQEPGSLLSELKAQHRLRAGSSASPGRILLADSGGLQSLALSLERTLQSHDLAARMSLFSDMDDLAREANEAEVDLLIVLMSSVDRESCSIHYYHGVRCRSVLGEELARQIATNLTTTHGIPAQVVGTANPILQTTRMPCVIADVSPISLVVEHPYAVRSAVSAAILNWIGRALPHSATTNYASRPSIAEQTCSSSESSQKSITI
jgi:N-acetylmuramoyl-L-alanine amidase